MKSSFKKLPGSKINLEVTLDAAEFKAYYDVAEADALANVELKGFRKGTAPRELAEKALNKEKVFGEAAEEAIRRTLHATTEEHEWSVIETPKIEIVSVSPTGSVGLEYKAELILFPEVTLGDYKRIAKKIFLEKQEIVVAPDDIEKAIQWVRESRAVLTAVSREAKNGDLVQVSFEGMVDGKPLPGAGAQNDRFVLGESRFLPGFDAHLEGKRAGETAAFPLAVPANHWKQELRGKVIDFKANVRAVYDRKLPDLTDDFVRGLGPNFKTVEDFRRSIGGGLREEREEKERERKRIACLEEITKTSRVDVPGIMAERTLDRMTAEAKPFLAESGKSEEEIRRSLEERARESVPGNLVVHGIAEAEHLEPNPDEVRKKAEHEHLDPKANYDYSYGIVQRNKVVAFLESQTNEHLERA